MNVHARKYNSSSVVGGPFPVIYSHLGSLQRGHSCRVQQQMHKMKRTKPKECDLIEFRFFWRRCNVISTKVLHESTFKNIFIY